MNNVTIAGLIADGMEYEKFLKLTGNQIKEAVQDTVWCFEESTMEYFVGEAMYEHVHLFRSSLIGVESKREILWHLILQEFTSGDKYDFIKHNYVDLEKKKA
jgi:hypothetical protein